MEKFPRETLSTLEKIQWDQIPDEASQPLPDDDIAMQVPELSEKDVTKEANVTPKTSAEKTLKPRQQKALEGLHCTSRSSSRGKSREKSRHAGRKVSQRAAAVPWDERAKLLGKFIHADEGSFVAVIISNIVKLLRWPAS